jgi:hypothetical protein
MKKLRLKSDAQRLSVSGFADRFASRMWLKRQSFVPQGAEDLADLAQSLAKGAFGSTVV